MTAAAVEDDDSAVLAASLDRPETFGTIYDRHFAEIYRYVARRLGPDAADDLAAEVFLAAFAQRHRFDPSRGRVRPWLYGIATNLVGRHRRDEIRRYRALARMPVEDVTGGPEDSVAARVSAQAVLLAPALRALKQGERDVLLLAALGDLGYDEIAEALGIPRGTVGSRLNRARRKLQSALGGTYPLGEELP